MKRSFVENLLKDLEADESVKKSIVDSIITENGNDINTEKTKTEGFKNDLKVKEGLIEELNTKIKEVGSVDIEEIKKKAREEGIAEGSKEVDEFKKTNALKDALKGFKAKDVDLLSKLLDDSKIEYENKEGNYTVKGIEDQIKSIQESHSYLFDEGENRDINLGGEHKNGSQEAPATLYGALKEKFN